MPRKSSSKSSARKRMGVSRRSSAIEADTNLLRDWANRNVEIELILHLAAVSVSYKGHIVEISSGTDALQDFMFLSSAGKMQVRLFPGIWHKTEIETVANVWRQLHIWGRRGLHNITIRESLGERKSNPTLQPVLTQLHSWAKQKTELAVFIQSGSHALFLLAEAIEISDGVFSFPERLSRHIQLVVSIDAFSHVDFEERNGDSLVKLIDVDRKLVISISAAPARTEDLFQRFKFESRLIH